jgi:hypothetical protein
MKIHIIKVKLLLQNDKTCRIKNFYRIKLDCKDNRIDS